MLRSIADLDLATSPSKRRRYSAPKTAAIVLDAASTLTSPRISRSPTRPVADAKSATKTTVVPRLCQSSHDPDSFWRSTEAPRRDSDMTHFFDASEITTEISSCGPRFLSEIPAWPGDITTVNHQVDRQINKSLFDVSSMYIEQQESDKQASRASDVRTIEYDFFPDSSGCSNNDFVPPDFWTAYNRAQSRKSKECDGKLYSLHVIV